MQQHTWGWKSKTPTILSVFRWKKTETPAGCWHEIKEQNNVHLNLRVPCGQILSRLQTLKRNSSRKKTADVHTGRHNAYRVDNTINFKGAQTTTTKKLHQCIWKLQIKHKQHPTTTWTTSPPQCKYPKKQLLQRKAQIPGGFWHTRWWNFFAAKAVTSAQMHSGFGKLLDETLRRV